MRVVANKTHGTMFRKNTNVLRTKERTTNQGTRGVLRMTHFYRAVLSDTAVRVHCQKVNELRIACSTKQKNAGVTLMLPLRENACTAVYFC